MGGYGRTPYATEVHNTPQKSPRNPDVTPWLIVIHHAATQSFDAVVQMENGSKQVSSTVIIKDGRVASMFDEAYRAWSLSSGYYDSVSLSSETCNSGGAAEGWPISEASYRTLAKVVAEWCRKYNIPANRERILGHKEVFTRYGASYATQCPGGIDLDRLVRMVNDYLTNPASGGMTPIEDEMSAEAEATIGKIYQILTEEKQFTGVEPRLRAVQDIVGRLYQITTEEKQFTGIEPRLRKIDAAIEKLSTAGIDSKALAKDIAAQIALPSGATKADVETIITTALGRIFR